MLVILLMMVLIWLGLIAFLAAWTIWFQGYLYTEPAGQMVWRAPAAGTALTVFLLIWLIIDYRAVKSNPDARFPYGPIQELAPATTDTTPFPTLYVSNGSGAEVEYKLTKVPDGPRVHEEYRRGQDAIPSRPAKVIVDENGEKTVFEPDRDAKGQYKSEPGQPLLYRDKKGRVLREGTFERMASYRIGPFVLGLFLNGMFFVVWFVCLWLLLRYQLWHALGLAIVMYAVVLLFIVGPVLSRAETVARPALPARSE